MIRGINNESMQLLITIICRIVIVTCFFFAVYNLVKNNYYRFDEKFDKIVEVVNRRYLENVIRENEKSYLKKGKETIKDKLENIISSSKIRGSIPFFNAEMLIVISLLFAALLATIVLLIIPNNLAAIGEAIILGAMLPTLILQEMSIRIFNQVDHDLDVFTIKGLSHSKSKSTLIMILGRCEEYITGPIKPVLSRLITDLNRGIKKEVAFNSASECVENIRVKGLFTNLLTASQNEGNYKKVFSDAEEMNREYFEIKDLAKDKIREGKSNLAALAVATIAAIWSLNRSFPNMNNILNDTKFGQIIIAYFGAIIIFLIYKLFSFSKINY